MSFSDELKQASKPIIEEIYNDGFIQDLLKGKLSKQAVRQYLRAASSGASLIAGLAPILKSPFAVKFLTTSLV